MTGPSRPEAEAGDEALRSHLLGELAGGIVHDVNNLLAVVIGLSDYLDLDATPEQRERLQSIRSNLHRGSTLLRELLGFAQLEDGMFERMGSVCALADAAAFVQGGFDPRYRVALDCPVDLEEIEGDANQLRQILVNLCVRAREALPEGGAITLRGARRLVGEDEAAELGAGAAAGPYVVLSVCDDAAALPAQERAGIFEPFHKGLETGRSTGLGMATVMRLVRRHRGFVTVESGTAQGADAGRGNTFACHFPACAPGTKIAW